MMTLTEHRLNGIKHAGLKAAKNGKPLSANPWEKSTPQHAYWRRGWYLWHNTRD